MFKKSLLSEPWMHQPEGVGTENAPATVIGPQRRVGLRREEAGAKKGTTGESRARSPAQSCLSGGGGALVFRAPERCCVYGSIPREPTYQPDFLPLSQGRQTLWSGEAPGPQPVRSTLFLLTSPGDLNSSPGQCPGA